MKMNVGSYKYRNSHKAYVKGIFQNIPKSKGRLVAISNGGYSVGALSPKFGYRIYFDKTQGIFNCQVYSQIRGERFGEFLREYGVVQGDKTALDSVTTAILYNEYRLRV